MRICFVTEKYPPVMGGGETHLQQLAVGLVERGCQVTVCTDRERVTSEIDPQGVRIVHIPGLGAACERLDCYKAVIHLHTELASSNYDVVHVANYVPAMLLIWLRTAVTVPICMSAFETYINEKRVFGLYNDFPLERTLQRAVVEKLSPDILFSGSNAYLRWAKAAGFNAASLVHIPFSTDIEGFAFDQHKRDSARATRGLTKGDYVFLVPARPIPRKRLEDVLSATAHLCRDTMRIIFTIPSGPYDHSYLQGLQSQYRQMGLESTVIWESNVDIRQMPHLLSASDAVILPSEFEGFAIALIEAMAARRPIITTDIEGPADFIENELTGLTYNCGDVQALAGLMQRVMGGGTEAMVDNAERLVKEKYSLSAMISTYLNHYRNVCEQ